MSKVRMINTRFWSDNFIREQLNPLDRYLFLYFLTNEKTNICGIYELPMSILASETGIEREMLEKMLIRLKGKIDYFEGWVVIRNFQKYQNTESPKVKLGIEKALSEIPPKIREFSEKGYSIDTISIPFGESKSESKSESKLELEREDTPSQIARNFFSRGKYYDEYLDLFSKNAPKQTIESEFDRFVLYWTEPNGSGTKVRWQQQSTFDVKRRLITWLSRINNFKGKETRIL